MSPKPRISIVTPSFNQGKFLEKTILSVLEQGYPNLEYIIIDGGSTDESVDIIKKYADRLTYWVSEPDRGQSHAINKGFERATGEIFGWLNSDDWYHPGALQAVAEAFAVNPEAGAVVGAGDFYSEQHGNSQTIAPFPVTVESLYGAVDRFFMQPSCLFTRQAWLSCGPLDETLQLAMDLDLWLKIAKEFSFAVIDNNLSASLAHQSAKTTALASRSLVDACLVIMRHGGEREGRQRLIAFLDELSLCRSYLKESNENAERTQRQLIHELHSRECELRDVHRALQQEQRTLGAVTGSVCWRLMSPMRQMLDRTVRLKSAIQGFIFIFVNAVRRLAECSHFVRRIFLSRQLGYGPKPRLLVSPISFSHVREPLHASISIVIPTKNGDSDFELLLRSIRSQKAIGRMEIIIVDSGSSDKTLEIANRYGCTVIEIPAASFNHSLARNLGADRATGDYIFFTVQDALLPNELFFYELLQFHHNNPVAAISCAEFPRHDADLYYRYCLYNHYVFLEVSNSDRISGFPEVVTHDNLRKSGQLSDLACLVPRERFMEFRYRGSYAEDLDLGIRLITAGHSIAFLGSLKVIHSHNRPAYYYLKRGFVDQEFLLKTFSDYPSRSITSSTLCHEIARGVDFVIGFIQLLNNITLPCLTNDVLDKFTEFVEKFECRAEVMLRVPFGTVIDKNESVADERFSQFIDCVYTRVGMVARMDNVDDSGLQLETAEGMKGFLRYVQMTHRFLDVNARNDLNVSLFKMLALHIGVTMKNCSLYDSNGFDQLVKELSLDIRGGV